MTKPDKPIIESLIDTDFYKDTMGQEILHHHPSEIVAFGLVNRTTSVRLGECLDIGRVREELDNARTLHPNKSDIHYLRGTNEYQERMFHEDYLEHRGSLTLPSYDLDIFDGQILWTSEAEWRTVTFWETLVLSIITELHAQHLMKGMSRLERDALFAQGRIRLLEKVRVLRKYPEITFTDFGTRRRFSREWQDYVVGVLAEELPGQFLGTSNTFLAMKYGILPMGTSAHERDMVVAGINSDTDEGIRQAIPMNLESWWKEYGQGLSIALTDTFGTDAFFKAMTPEQARDWKGLRQDSGDPFTFANKAIAFYKSHGIDPREKMIVFSDGLEIEKILALAQHCKNRIKATFGWGTNLNNDLGLPTLSLVVKTVKANGRPLVKLSDNLAKAIGPKDEIERYKRIFGYTGTTFEQPRY